MDERQIKLISSSAAQISDKVNFIEFARLLKLANLVSKEKVDQIISTVESNFCRNLKLIDAVQASESSVAFDKFIEVLEGFDELVEVISNMSGNRKQNNIIGRVFEKFGYHPNSESRKYPLGMHSGSTNNPASSSSNYLPHQTDYPATSPFKEKHQATLITSGPGSANKATNTRDNSFQLLRSTRSNPGADYLIGSNASFTPPTTSNQNNGVGKLHLNQTFANRASQTPTRSHELARIQNLSLSDQQEESEIVREGDAGSDSDDNGEPLVCWHPYAQSHSGDQDARRANSPHYCHPCSSASSESGDSSSDSLMMDQNLILDSNVTMAIAQGGTNLMAVKLASVCHNNSEEDYKMTARPRGPCLIVNNIDFESDIFPTRKGSDEDARRFDDIFKQLGFTVIMRRNQTADQMRQSFKDVAAECKQEHDSLFVFILSHGSEHGIYGVDGMEVYLESEIISCFDNRNCKAMLGKPKVFVIQACRGRSKDCGGDGDATDSIAWPSVLASPSVRAASQENRVPASWLPSSLPLDGKKRKHPIRTDMLLVFSCLAGFVSVRNELAGSWLGVALAYFIMTHAHERDLLRILNLVTSDVIQRESSHGHIQSIELKLLGWTKNLYFNPGIYL